MFHQKNKMRILAALTTVFMVSGAVAQKKPTKPNFDGNDVVMCDGGKGGSTWSCKDPKTGKTQEVQCKTPPKQKPPPKLSMVAVKVAAVTTWAG